MEERRSCKFNVSVLKYIDSTLREYNENSMSENRISHVWCLPNPHGFYEDTLYFMVAEKNETLERILSGLEIMMIREEADVECKLIEIYPGIEEDLGLKNLLFDFNKFK